MNKDQILEETLKQAFRDWWYEEGSGIIPLRGHDLEEHANRVAEIAWLKGAGCTAAAAAKGGRKMRHVYSFTFLAMMTCGFYLATHSADGSVRYGVGMLLGIISLSVFTVCCICEYAYDYDRSD
jgi:hypothetical protein